MPFEATVEQTRAAGSPDGIAGGVSRQFDHSVSISVVVPVRNEARFIRRTLDCLLGQDYDPCRFEILVVDGQSSDGTPQIVEELSEEHANLRLLHNPRRLSSVARNIGIRNARGEVVLIVDGHCEIPEPRHLSRLASALARSGADAIGRPQPLDVPGSTVLQRAIAAARSSRLGHHPDSFIYSTQERFVPAKSVAVAYRRTVFDQIGYFDEAFDACEDVEFNHRLDRAGLKCFFTPEVAVHYAPRASLRGLFHQLVRYGRGRVRLLRKHPDTFSLAAFVPALFLAGVALGPLVGLIWRPMAMAYIAVLLLYAAILVAGSVAAGRSNDRCSTLLLPLVFATVHLGSGTGLLRELVWPARSAKAAAGNEVEAPSSRTSE